MSIAKTILLLWTLICLSMVCLGQGQKIDSLKNVLPALKDNAKVDCLIALSDAYMTDPGNGNDIWTPLVRGDSARFFAQKALEQADVSDYIKGKAKAYYNLGGIGITSLTDLRTTERYLRKALESALQTTDEHFIGCVYGRLGVSLWYQSKFAEAMESLEKAERLFQKTGDKQRLAVTYFIISTAELERGYYEKSMQYALKSRDVLGEKSLDKLASLYQIVGDYEAALNLFRKENHNQTTQYYSLYMGEIFVARKRFDSANYYYKNFQNAMEESIGKTMREKLHSHLGELYLCLNKYDTALIYLKEALKWQKKVNDGNEIMWTLLRLARTFTEKTDYKKAKIIASELLNKAKETGARQYISEAHYLLYNIFQSLHSQDSAFFHLRQFTITKGILDKDLSAHKLAFYKAESEREEAQLQIALLNKEKEVQQAKLEQTVQQRKFLLAGVVALLLIGVIFFRNILLQRKNERHLREIAENELQIQKLESERTNAELQRQAGELEMQALRAQMNPHFIFNSLNSINRFILQNNKAEASEYLTKFSRLVRLILQNSQSSLISLESEIESLQLYLELEVLRFDGHFEFKIGVDDELETDIIKVPPLIMQPYAENAIWHGIMNKEGEGHLWINISEEGSTLICTITDDGIGRAKAAKLEDKSGKHKSMGTKITESRIAMMQKMSDDKSIEIMDLIDADGNAAGTEVVIKIPLTQLC